MTAALERVQPRMMVCGHIHPAYGRDRLGETEIINSSVVDEVSTGQSGGRDRALTWPRLNGRGVRAE
jgi:hypothetical protein